MTKPQYVSVHGGHSGQFCKHAKDLLEEIIRTYIEYGYAWVGVTEHAPGISHQLLYQDERDAGLTPELLLENFANYMTECRRLQQKYQNDITIYAAMEIETYSPTHYKIQSELHNLISALGHDSRGISHILNSWGDTMDEEATLQQLKDYNEMVKTRE